MVVEGKRYQNINSILKDLLETHGHVPDNIILSTHSIESNSVWIVSVEWDDKNIE